MNLLKEPKGVDFIIESKPLSDVERKEISEYIQQQKLKKKVTTRTTKVKQAPSKHSL